MIKRKIYLSHRFRDSGITVNDALTDILRSRKGEDVNVNCGTCNACCRTYKYIADECPVVDSKCINLNVNGKCSIYRERPNECTTFQCYEFSLMFDDPKLSKKKKFLFSFRIESLSDIALFVAVRISAMSVSNANLISGINPKSIVSNTLTIIMANEIYNYVLAEINRNNMYECLNEAKNTVELMRIITSGNKLITLYEGVRDNFLKKQKEKIV